MQAKTIEEVALYYLSRGWSVIPLLSRDKRPAIGWMDYQHRHATENEVRAWFCIWPDGNLGIITGTISGLVVIDVDPKHGGDASLKKLEEEYGPVPRTIEAATGGGGRHIYFVHPGGFIHNKVGFAPGMDLRGDGGCVVAPPSLHWSGRHYVWIGSHEPETATLASMPEWLLKAARTGGGRLGHPLSHWRHLVREGVPEGKRNNTIASLSGHLLWHGVDPDIAVELLLCWNAVRCRPPLSDEEVVRTVESIVRLHRRHTEPDSVSELREQ